MDVEESLGAFSCDTGSGRLGEMLQHSDIGDISPMLLGAVSATVPIIAAIFGQCGSHGCPGCVDPWTQQPAIATAGEANRLTNSMTATSLERIFTIKPVLIVPAQNHRKCDSDHILG
jgi:hypothetical protein